MDRDEAGASLRAWVERMTFTDLTADEVTDRLVDGAAAWAGTRGLRVYRRAASVVRLPPPYEQQHSVLDIACAQPDGPPIVVEVDRSDRRRTLDKLAAEAEAGRIAVWIRWGTGPFTDPPAPVVLVPVTVTARRRPDRTKVHSRLPSRAAPSHSVDLPGDFEAAELPID
jgi:hypothetical protein